MSNNGSLVDSQILFLVVIASATLFFSNPSFASHEDELPGLDQRPTNQNCLATANPEALSGVALEHAFPNLVLVTPTSMVQPPGDPAHWYLSERDGQVYRFDNNDETAEYELALNLWDHFENMSLTGQWGLMSFAFHPDWPTNPTAFVAYNSDDGIGTTRYSYVSRYTSLDGVTFDPASEEIIMSIEQSGGTGHSIGSLNFSPIDGLLYISMGDNGENGIHAQNIEDVRGKILRIDIDGAAPYTIPPDNPYADTPEGRPEIYAIGLRNPWRFSFDSLTGDLWVGDVGNSNKEEVTRVERGDNLGWNVLEGTQCLFEGCDPSGLDLTPPVVEYTHDQGCAVMGGYVYRGTQIPSLEGAYVYADHCSGHVWGLTVDQNDNAVVQDLGLTTPRVCAFGEALDGTLYALGCGIGESVQRLVPPPPPSGSTPFPQKLSETGCMDPANPRQPMEGLIPYNINSPLWSDGAAKNRWMAVPDGTTVTIEEDGDWTFPLGTVLVKEFAFDDAPVETRLMMLHDDGVWAGYSYEWNADLTDATLLLSGKSKVLDNGITWSYPSQSQCLLCHTEVAGRTLGPESAQFNRDSLYPSTGRTANQLATLDHIGLFEDGLPAQPKDTLRLFPVDDETRPVAHRARSYLHSNCSHCHQDLGWAPPSSETFLYHVPVEDMRACNVTPSEGNVGVAGAKILTPGDPSRSVISLRMHALDENRMPLFGRSVVDPTGTAVVDAWISQADVCDPQLDADTDGMTDNIDNCPILSNADQSDHDADQFGDMCDNCIAVANADQRDSNGDGFGNLCDADLDNNGTINFLDFVIFKDSFGGTNADADLNGDNEINFLDLTIMANMFLGSPGPSGLVP